MDGPPGAPAEEGMVPRAVAKVFEGVERLRVCCRAQLFFYIQRENWDFECEAMFLEIYREELRDLLEPNPAAAKKLEIKHTEQPKPRTTVLNLQYG